MLIILLAREMSRERQIHADGKDISRAWRHGACKISRTQGHARAKDFSRRGGVPVLLQDQMSQLRGLHVTQPPLEHDLGPAAGVTCW